MFYKNILFFILFFFGIGYSKPVSIIGTIKTTSGKPVKKAIVSLLDLNNKVLIESKSNRKGKFSLEGVEPNFYYLVINHDKHGSKRIKLNPRKTRNRDLVLRLILSQTDSGVKSYYFSNKNPTDYDPALNIKDLDIKISSDKINVMWKDLKQAKNYVLFENDNEVQSNSSNLYERKIEPGIEYCYKVQAFGDYGLKGQMSNKICGDGPTHSPENISLNINKNTIQFEWPEVSGAISYIIYRNDEKIGEINSPLFLDIDLEYNKEYSYSISALTQLGNESSKSVDIKAVTHEYNPAPILSSMKDDKKIILIWNEINVAQFYNIYRDGEYITKIVGSSYSEFREPGVSFCYQITSVDQYGIESEFSNQHCQKIMISPPNDIIAEGGVRSIYLNWNFVSGASYFKVYRISDNDKPIFLEKIKSNQLKIRDLSYSDELCYVISAIDKEGDEGELSKPICGIVKSAPNFIIKKWEIIEPSGNNKFDSRENGKIRFAVHNNGESPAYNITSFLIPTGLIPKVIISDNFVIDTLFPDLIEYIELDVFTDLKVESGIYPYQLEIESNDGIKLDMPYPIEIETKAVDPPSLIVADFAVSNDFGTHYIPRNEEVIITIRIQNVGEGYTEFVKIKIPENRTFKTKGFDGLIEYPGLKSGDYIDIEIPIISEKDNFTIQLELIDYLDESIKDDIYLELMRRYRSPDNLVTQELGSSNVNHYADELGNSDVDSSIPFGRKNPNAMSIILYTEQYNDTNYPDLDYANKDGEVIRKYFQNAFGLSDYQLLPSKPWQMEGGPTLDEFNNIFDPHNGDIRKRIVSADKYSGIESMDIFIYLRSYGEWSNGRPLLIPKDAKSTRDVTKYPLDQLIKNLSVLSVLENINTITIFLDITYTNPEGYFQSNWDYPDLPKKVCILSAASNSETSQFYPEKNHSLFTYALLKGLSGSADDGDNIIELGELTDYIYRKVPELSRTVQSVKDQNPNFKGMDLHRTILDLR